MDTKNELIKAKDGKIINKKFHLNECQNYLISIKIIMKKKII